MNDRDVDLLQRYLEEASQPAFTELVARHLNLVYSVARRIVRSPELAEDVAQSVFSDLAQNARRLPTDISLVAWLHVVARRTAIDAVRRDARRRGRENAAATDPAHRAPAALTMTPDSSAWTEIEPLLDEAVESLPASDRTAILLRFFENKSLRDVGAALGTSDDAAQKRVTRALDQLRTFFLRRGIAITAAGLATDLSAHALHVTPVGLGAAISAAAALSGSGGAVAVLQATKAAVMTTFQKSAVAVTLVLFLGGGLFEATVSARQQSDLAARRTRTPQLEAEIRRLAADQAAAAARLAAVERQIDARLAITVNLPVSGDPALEAQMRAWFGRIDRLKQLMAQRPNLSVPELQYLTDREWFKVASTSPLESDNDVRRAFIQLRNIAGNGAGSAISKALTAYVKANADSLPDNPLQLAPFFDRPVDPALLQRYEMLYRGKLSDVPADKHTYGLLGAAVMVDPENDDYWNFGLTGRAARPAMAYNVDYARKEFSRLNPGQKASEAAQLAPYLKWPVDITALQRYLTPPPVNLAK